MKGLIKCKPKANDDQVFSLKIPMQCDQSDTEIENHKEKKPNLLFVTAAHRWIMKYVIGNNK